MIARSYVKTRNLEELASRDPQLAEQVEALCKTVLALRGFAVIHQANGVLSFAATATAPFVEMKERDKPLTPFAQPSAPSEPAKKPLPESLSATARLLSAKANNKHGLPGVRFNAQRGNYVASIIIDGKKTHLGSFETAEEAGKAYEAAFRERLCARIVLPP